ncbi:MAG: transporter [Deltaproteobacteria bacterium]|nr:transporter [Deltaproteobacteria bacterium]
MKKFMTQLLGGVAAVLFLSSPAWGAGFLIFEQGAKAMGMAGAFTATADDPTTVFNNPAGITQLEGTQISFGNTFIRNDQSYDVDSALIVGKTYHEEMGSKTFFLPHLYVTQKYNDRLSVGFGVFSPFGIGTDWADNSVGNSVANETTIKTYNLNPNVAYKITPKLSLALGVNYIRTNIQIQRRIGAESFVPGVTPVMSYEVLGQEQLGRLQVDGRGGGWAYNVGLLYKINESWQAGFSYRSDYKIEISRSQSSVTWSKSSKLLSDLSVLNPALAAAPFNPLVNSSTEGFTRLNLPGIFLAGVSTTMFDQWNIEFDVQYTTWNHFDDIVIEVEPPLNLNPFLPGIKPGVDITQDTLPALQEDWENGWGFHLGTEYHYTENFAVRTGYFYDKNPIPDRTLGPILPDSDRQSFSLGCGYTKGNWTMDAAYMYSHFKNRSTDKNYQNFNASYKSDFQLLGLTLTRKL